MTDITKIDFNLLKTLALLVEEQSVSRVAVRMDLKQPTVSASLKKLREIFDDPLFVRHPHGLRPTPRTEALAPELKAWIRGLELIVEPPVFVPASANRTFFVVAGDYSEWIILPKLCATLAREAPGVRIAVVHAVMGRAQKMFEAGEIDLALSVPRLSAPWLKSRRLLDDSYCVVARKGHPRIGSTLTLDDYCREPHCATVRDDNILERTTTDRILADMGRERHITYYTRNFSAALHMVENTDLIGMGLRRTLPKYPNLKAYPVPFTLPPYTILATWHERAQLDPAHSWLRERLAEAATSAAT